MKTLKKYINERFINQENVIIYPCGEDFTSWIKNHSRKEAIWQTTSKGYKAEHNGIWVVPKSEAMKLKLNNSKSMKKVMPHDITRDEFIKQWKDNKITKDDIESFDTVNDSYINERFISKKEYILVYPWFGLLNELKGIYPDDIIDSKVQGGGIIFCLDISELDKIKKLSKEYQDDITVFRCPGDFDKEEFKKKWEGGEETFLSLLDNPNYKIRFSQ